MTSVVAYVDGFNLYFGLKRKYGRRYLCLDLVELVRQVRPADDVLRVRYFTAVVKGEPAAAANQIDYIEALQAHCGSTLELQRGWFKPRKIDPCKICGQRNECSCPRRFRSYEEKETDVALGAAMVEDAAAGVGDLTLLVSADSDFMPAVQSVKRLVPARPVLLAMPPGNLQPHKRFAGAGFFNINETALRRSQLPETVLEDVTDPGGTCVESAGQVALIPDRTRAAIAAIIHRIESDDHGVAADLSQMLARGELPQEVAAQCVPHAWKWNNRPLADLSQQQWIELFRFAGHTHDYTPAARPSGRAVRLWRGAASAERMSWTTDRKLARGFAIRNAGLDANVGVFGEQPTLWVALVDPTRLLAYLSFEKEYVIDPLGLTAEQVRIKL